MSKCPDGEVGEATIATVMENVGNKVSLNFTYIASYVCCTSINKGRWQNSSHGGQTICKHGPEECLGNKQQLW